MEHPIEGWDIVHGEEAAWVPWGSGERARAKVLGAGDGYVLAVVEADAGYVGDVHDHVHTEALVVLDGEVRTQGRVLGAGDGYVAAAGSRHTDFAVEAPARYISLFRL